MFFFLPFFGETPACESENRNKFVFPLKISLFKLHSGSYGIFVVQTLPQLPLTTCGKLSFKVSARKYATINIQVERQALYTLH